MMMIPRDQVLITDDDRHAVLSICTIMFLVLSIISFFGRLFTKRFAVGMFNRDDYIMLVCLIFSIGQSIAVLIASENGLGRHWDAILSQQRIRFEKAFYSSGLLYIVTIVLSKLSTIYFIRGLSPIASRFDIGNVLAIIFGFWGVASLFAAAFERPPPAVWRIDSPGVFNVADFWIAFAAINITTDAILIAWPVGIIIGLQTSWKRKIVIILCFAARLMAIGAMVAQLYYLNLTSGTSDFTFDLFSVAMINQIVVALSIFTACVPYMRPFFESLETGMIRNDDLRRRAPSMFSSKYKSNRKDRSGNSSLPKSSVILRPLENGANRSEVQAEPNGWHDAESVSSRSRFINMETTFDVRSESGQSRKE